MSGNIIRIFMCFRLIAWGMLANAQVTIIDSLPSNVHILPVSFKTAEWFGVRKFTIEEYGTGKSKTGIRTESVDNDYGIGGSKTKYKFSVWVNTDSSGDATVKGNVEIFEFYETPSAGEEAWNSFKTNITGLESETIPGRLSFRKILQANINGGVAGQETGTWFLTLHKTDYTALDSSGESFMEMGDRKIYIMQPPLVKQGNDSFQYDVYKQRYDFVEDGRVLGAFDNEDMPIILLRKELEPSIRLILVAAMISIHE